MGLSNNLIGCSIMFTVNNLDPTLKLFLCFSVFEWALYEMQQQKNNNEIKILKNECNLTL